MIDEMHAYKHQMWLVTDRTFIPAGIEYKEQEVPIAPCQTCYEKHHKTYMKMLRDTILVGVYFIQIQHRSVDYGNIRAYICLFFVRFRSFLLFGYFSRILGISIFKMINKIPRESDVTEHLLVRAFEDLG